MDDERTYFKSTSRVCQPPQWLQLAYFNVWSSGWVLAFSYLALRICISSRRGIETWDPVVCFKACVPEILVYIISLYLRWAGLGPLGYITQRSSPSGLASGIYSKIRSPQILADLYGVQKKRMTSHPGYLGARYASGVLWGIWFWGNRNARL